jgi:hypothetical protein
MSTLDPRIEKLRVEYGLERTDFWELPQKKGTWLVKHSALETVAAKAGITFDMPEIIEARTAEKIAVIVARGFKGDRSEWSFGEASPLNNRNTYPFAMAEKRAKDRVILKLAGLHGLVYSEDEIADDAPPAPKSSAELKRSSSWDKFAPELAEVTNEIQLENFLAAWRKITIAEGWNMALKETARDLIEGKRAELAKPVEDDDTFPGDKPNAYEGAFRAG